MPAAALASPPPRHSRLAVAMHWAMAVLLLAQLALGWWMLTLPDTPPGPQAGWFNLHKSIGLTIGLLVLLRLAVRPGRPALLQLPQWQRRAAAASHAVLYACMVLLPVSGYLGSSFSGYPVRFYGTRLPQWAEAWPAGKQFFSLLHEALVWTFVGVLVLHVLAALWHWAWRRDGVAEGMGLPSLSRSRP